MTCYSYYSAGADQMSDKAFQVLVLEPSTELHFKGMISRAGMMIFNFYNISGPFTKVVTVLLKIMNSACDRVCFRVLATSPNHYQVRPAYDILEAKDTRLVTGKNNKSVTYTVLFCL